ncbi:MAG: hypothetical protein K2X29_09685, partial [Candidatus Obscuribacterales bacterium]|nr:hypothetical protein [Candidatus Obscuribacterales bacterium]
VLILALIFVFIPNFIFGDGSTGWHLVTGHYVLDHMQTPTKDLISYTFADKPWVAYEWLFDTVIAGLDKIAGLKLVSVACCSAIAWLFLLLYDDCRKRGCHFLPAMLICIMGALISAIHWLARPHLVTFFAVYIYTKYLQEFFENKISARKLLLVLGLTMLIWVNSHPAFLMGIVITGIYLVSELMVYFSISQSETKNESFKRCKSYGLALLTVLLVSFINPYGLELYKYIAEYLQQTAVISQTDEYGSPVFHGQLQSVLLELLFFALAIGLVCTDKKPALPRLLTVLAYAHLTLASKRNMPLFVIVSLPFIAELFAHFRVSLLAPLQNTTLASWLSPFKKILVSTGETMDTMEFACNKHALPAVTVLILAISCFNNGKALGIPLVKSDFDPKTKPTATLDCLKEQKLDEKQGFTFDNWGGYIRYKTGMRVFIDDRVDFYGQKFYLDYGDIATGQTNWRDVLSRYKINWVLFPNNSILVANLKTDPNWKLLCEDQSSCLYKRLPEASANPAGSN